MENTQEPARYGVLMSIRPRWCDLILGGVKHVEVRKTRPKLEPPFRVYLYRTREGRYVGGDVVASFVCDRIDAWPIEVQPFNVLAVTSLMSPTELRLYAGKSRRLYAWHISGLRLFDRPLALQDFRNRGERILRAPQSWCYAEEAW